MGEWVEDGVKGEGGRGKELGRAQGEERKEDLGRKGRVETGKERGVGKARTWAEGRSMGREGKRGRDEG